MENTVRLNSMPDYEIRVLFWGSFVIDKKLSQELNLENNSEQGKE